MTDQQHPITPPPELVTSLRDSAPYGLWETNAPRERWLVNHAYAAGADQELEACCDHIRDHQWGFVDQPDGTKGMHRAVDLKLARRPKPPTLNSIALQMLGTIERDAHYLPEITDTIRKALEQLRALEALTND